MITAWWDPGWYNLDQSLSVGQRRKFAFFWGLDVAIDDPRIGFHPHPESLFMTRPPYDLVFANGIGRAWDYRSAFVESIEHAQFGPVDEVDATAFGQYTFRFCDGAWVTIEAEQGLGRVNSASPGFPVDACERDWARNSGWALTVTLTDVSEAGA